MIKFFLSRVLKWFASMNWDQFLDAVEIVKNAAALFHKPKELTDEENAAINFKRALHVSKWIAANFPTLPTWTVNLVRELAVGWMNRTK